MKTKTYVQILIIALTISSCSTTSKTSKQSNLDNQKEKLCEKLVWYVFINGKPDRIYLENSKKVAERWGFKIIYKLGNCTNSEEAKQKYILYEEKSMAINECMLNTLGENWKNKFREEVKAENNK